jgi:hypothetical protein
MTSNASATTEISNLLRNFINGEIGIENREII